MEAVLGQGLDEVMENGCEKPENLFVVQAFAFYMVTLKSVEVNIQDNKNNSGSNNLVFRPFE